VTMPAEDGTGSWLELVLSSESLPSGLSPPQQSPKGTMPAYDGLGANDDDRVEHRTEDASGEREQHASIGIMEVWRPAASHGLRE
jgi:hypothetical protein